MLENRTDNLLFVEAMPFCRINETAAPRGPSHEGRRHFTASICCSMHPSLQEQGFADSRISARPPNELARLPFFMNQMLSQRLLVLPPPDDYCDQHDICDNNANVRYNSYDLHFLPPLPVTIYIDNEP